MVWLHAHPLPLPCTVSFSQSSCVSPTERWGRGVGDGGAGVDEEVIIRREEAWPSINHSILSGIYFVVTDRLSQPRQENILFYRTEYCRPANEGDQSVSEGNSLKCIP
jgi:hypothetical protein